MADNYVTSEAQYQVHTLLIYDSVLEEEGRVLHVFLSIIIISTC